MGLLGMCPPGNLLFAFWCGSHIYQGMCENDVLRTFDNVLTHLVKFWDDLKFSNFSYFLTSQMTAVGRSDRRNYIVTFDIGSSNKLRPSGAINMDMII